LYTNDYSIEIVVYIYVSLVQLESNSSERLDV